MDEVTRRHLAWECEDEILKLIDDQNELTRSDLQGCVSVVVSKLMRGILEVERKAVRDATRTAD